MNYNIYFYGNSKKGFSQYPDNYTKDIINETISLIGGKGQSQVAISRNSNLVYFIYNYSISNNDNFGICLEYNKVFPYNLKYMSDFFETIVNDILNKGTLLCYTEEGGVRFGSDFMYKQSSIVEYYINFIQVHLDDLQANFKHLPPLNFGMYNTQTTYFSLDEKIDLSRTLSDNHIIIVTKDAEAYAINSYRNILNRLNNEILEVKKQNVELQEKNKKILRQKKQYATVFLLIFVVIGCAIGLFFLYGNLNNTQSMLSDANNTITAKNSIIKNKNEFIQNQKNSIDALNVELNTERNKMSDFKDKVGSFMPIIITDIQIANTYSGGDIETDYGNTIYSSSTMYLKPKITYTGIKTGEDIDLNVKFYTPSGMSTGPNSPYGYSYSTSIYVYSGENTKSLTGWGGVSRGHWRSGTYRFEIWYGDVCLKSKTFTVY